MLPRNQESLPWQLWRDAFLFLKRLERCGVLVIHPRIGNLPANYFLCSPEKE